jgi:hypothetical protein
VAINLVIVSSGSKIVRNAFKIGLETIRLQFLSNHLNLIIYSLYIYKIQFKIRECIQKFPDWACNEICAFLLYYSFRSNTKGYGGKTH